MDGHTLSGSIRARRHDRHAGATTGSTRPRRGAGGRLLRLAALVVVACVSQACAGTSSQVLPVLPGLESYFADEPVFGGRIHFYEGGDPDNPPIVLVHGIDRSGANSWRNLIDHLDDDYSILAIDLPGFGQSARGSHYYSPDRYVDVLASRIDAFTDEPVHLVGHSLGGAVGLRYAEMHPGQVEHLHLVSVAGILHRASYSGFLVRAGGADGTDADHADSLFERMGGRLLRKFFRRVDDGPNIAASPWARETILRDDPARIAGVALLATDYSETLANVTTPTSVYWGARDSVAPLRTGRLLAARLPGRDLSIFPDVGHVPMLEIPDRFAGRLLARIEGSSAGPDVWLPPVAEPGDRVASCRDDGNVTFRGAYDRIEIVNCRRVMLDRVTARHIEIRESRVTLREPRILGAETGLKVAHSDITITAGEIVGDTAIDITQTFLDVAGTHLHGRDTAIRAGGGGSSELTLSVTPFTSGGERGYLHDIRAFAAGDTI